MQPKDSNESDKFIREVEHKAQQKLKALQNGNRSLWFGLGMMGIVGWTIAVPALSGAAAGIWLDKKYPEVFSWSLTGLVIGMCAGCLIAWRWLNKEHSEINRKN